MGMDMARATARQAQENPDKAEELNRVVDRLTRSAMASDRLRRKLAKDLDKRHATARCQVAAQPPTAYVAPPTSRLVH